MDRTQSSRRSGRSATGLRRVLHVALAAVTAVGLATVPEARASLLHDTFVDASVQLGSTIVTYHRYPITGQFVWDTAGIEPGVSIELGGAGPMSGTYAETPSGIAASINVNGGWS